MNPELPAALAVAGTALMAVAFFGPFRRGNADTDEAPPAAQWPALVEASAVACDATARIDLADALGALQSPWSEEILRRAYQTEDDPLVRSAIETALRQAQERPLSSSQSLVT